MHDPSPNQTSFGPSCAFPRASSGAERRGARRVQSNRNVRLVARSVEGFVLDLSRSGMRLALFATGDFVGGTVLVSLEGDGEARLGVVKWARAHVDGTIVGIELLEERQDDVRDLDDEVVLIDDATPLPEEITQIRAVPICTVRDVPGAKRTLEEGSVVVVGCVRLVA